MRTFKAWGLAATLAWGLTAAVAPAAEDDTDGAAAPPPRPFIRWSPYAARMFGVAPGRPPENQPPRKTAVPQRPRAKKPAAPQKALARPATSEHSRDEAALLRRLAVCDKLKEIALRSNDEPLLHQAEQLEASAWATYQQRTGSTGDGGLGGQGLEQPVGLRSAATLSGAEVPARPYPGKDDGIAAAKEVDR